MYKLQLAGLTRSKRRDATYCLEYIGMNMSFSTADFILAMIAVTRCSSALLDGKTVGYSCMRWLRSPTKRSVCVVDIGSQTASTSSVGSKQNMQKPKSQEYFA
jgi:alpha-D-ribose 1-methylphosphonate 5-triphosphate synthase subunit PhnG